MKRLGLLISLIMVVSLLSACATPTPKVEEKVVTQIVKETVKETVIVEGTPKIVEKEVTKVVEKVITTVVEKVVTATPEPAEEKEKSDVVIVGMAEEPEFTNVMYTQGGNSLALAKMAQRGLLFLDEESNWIGELAKEVPSLENSGISPDGKTITFKLREGVTWHDGKPVTSADVKATWEAIMNPDNTPITRFGYDQIESIDTPDDLTVTLNFPEPFTSWPILFDFILPKHVIEENSPGLDESKAMQVPIGFGPYKFVEWKVGDFVEYEAFDDYWRGGPKIDRVVVRMYPSTDALLQAIEAKEVDIAWSQPASFVPKLEALESKGIRLFVVPRVASVRFHMNPRAPIFADKTLRQALQHAVDKQFLIDELLFGRGALTDSEWGGSPWENPNLVRYEYSPGKCREMLESLGWKDEDGDGIREAHGVEGFEDGTRLSFMHYTTAGDIGRENRQLIVQQMFKECGVEMKVESRRAAELFGTWSQGGVWSHGDYEMGDWVHGLNVPDPEISTRFLCSEIASEENQSGSQWFLYCNPEVDELLMRQAGEMDPEKRKEILFRVQEIYHDDAYTIFLYRHIWAFTAREELKNFVLHPFAKLYWNPQEWEWEE